MTTEIEWTDETWNPVTGCDKVSQGCKHCYAEALAARLKRMGNPRYERGFEVTLHPDKLEEPLRWRKPRRVFVNSMSDLLHQRVPDDFILRAFEVMAEADAHEFQVLTKRPERWAGVTEIVRARLGRWPANVLPGTSVEDRPRLGRLELLAKAGGPGTVRMVSAEPLLESLTDDPARLGERLTRCGVGWVITGGESGPKARPAEVDWFREVRDACVSAGIPFFHKQHGGRGPGKAGKRGGEHAEIDGRLHHALPEVGAAAQGRLL